MELGFRRMCYQTKPQGLAFVTPEVQTPPFRRRIWLCTVIMVLMIKFTDKIA